MKVFQDNMYTYDIITSLKYQITDNKIGVFRLCPLIAYTTPVPSHYVFQPPVTKHWSLHGKSLYKSMVSAFGRLTVCNHQARGKEKRKRC